MPDQPPVRWSARNAPLLAFGVVYGTTCLLGALLFLADYTPFVALFEHFSGTRTPTLSDRNFWIALVLLLLAPALLAAGYMGAFRINPPGILRRRSSIDPQLLEPPVWLPFALFVLLVGRGAVDLVRADALVDVSSWLDYQAWVAARGATFERISFFGFVNLYLWMPLTAAWCLLTAPRALQPSGSRIRKVVRLAPRWLPTAITLAFSLLLFQKKAAVVSLGIVLTASVLYVRPSITRAFKVRLSVGALCVAIFYFTLVIVPVSGGAPKSTGLNLGPVWDDIPAVVLYTALAPLTRTSAPALYYPVVYPRYHPFYGLDAGQDVAGVGRSPDDNTVVWRFMNPTLAGTTAAPYQFPLYSQVGLIGTLASSAVLGFCLGLAWRISRHTRFPLLWSSLAGTLTLLFAVYLAVDSARNGLLVSYGVLWGYAFLAFGAALVIAVNTALRRLSTTRSTARAR